MTDVSVQLSVTVHPQIRESQPQTYYGSSILISNPGDDDVTINRGLTIKAGQAVTFKTGDDMNIIVFNLSFLFAGVGVAPLVEVVTMQPDEKQFNNYQPKRVQ